MAKGSKRNQARAAAQAKKSARVEKRASSSSSSSKSSSKSSGGNSGGSSSKSSGGSSSQQAAKNQVQQRLGDEQYKNVSQSGLQDATKQGSYSANEVIAEFRNRGKGVSVDEGDNSVLNRFKTAQAGGATFNKKAQDYLKNFGMTFGQKEKEKEPVKKVVKEPVKEVAKDPVKAQAQNFANNKVIEQMDSGKVMGDNQNTIGDNNKFYGNVNQGNQDFSVNFSGGSGDSSEPMNNMESSVAYQALNENAYERSKAKFSASGRAQQAVDQALESTKVDQFVDNSNTASEMMRRFYADKSNNYMVGLFGDRSKSSYKPPSWNAPAAPAKIESTYDKDDED